MYVEKKEMVKVFHDSWGLDGIVEDQIDGDVEKGHEIIYSNPEEFIVFFVRLNLIIRLKF